MPDDGPVIGVVLELAVDEPLGPELGGPVLASRPKGRPVRHIREASPALVRALHFLFTALSVSMPLWASSLDGAWKLPRWQSVQDAGILSWTRSSVKGTINWG